MQRRDFIGTAAATLGLGALTGCVMDRSGGGGTAISAANGSKAGANNRRPLDAAAFHAERRFAATPFGKIAYIERGARIGAGADDAALFLHGFPLNSFQWRGAIEHLSDERRCIAPDFMGLGHTEPLYGQSVSAAAQVDMLAAFLDKLSIATVDIVASDSGGAVAQLFIVKYPRRVRTLLLANCDTEIDCPPPALMPVIELSREGKFVDRWLAPWLADKKLARSAQGIGGMCYGNPMHPTDEAIEYYFSPLVNSPVRKAQAHAYAIALDHNVLAGVEPALKRSNVPTRIVWGTDDKIFAVKSPEYLSSVLGRSRGVRQLAGSKLFWPEERPDVIAEEARALWAEPRREAA
jgi:haloalkane dehalogenase